MSILDEIGEAASAMFAQTHAVPPAVRLGKRQWKRFVSEVLSVTPWPAGLAWQGGHQGGHYVLFGMQVKAVNAEDALEVGPL